MIQIRPARARRQAFARWAVAQTPKVRTVSPADFAVPADLYAQMPEHILIGSQVEGHDYVSPELAGGFTEPHIPPPAPDELELTGVATADAFMPLPGDEPESEPANTGAAARRYTCPDCARPFKSARGRDTHRRHAHEG